ncbi:MAG: Gfo/Idh/MocA family oxidoreductase [Bryobacterales bacterium]|nr:Gfo/Idh/MocA family oxidoreductase [Bryobacterales bacterium]
MAEKQGEVTRRGFGKSLAAGAAVAAPASVASAQIATPGAGQYGPVVVGNYRPVDQIKMGGIGIRSRGMDSHARQEMKRIVSPDRTFREDAREMVKSTVDGYYKDNECKMYRDAAEILANPEIDALLIATSDRWHGLMAMWAAQSGKDIYIEKPGAMFIAESYSMAENVERYGIVYQSGAQRKNQYAFEFAVGLARSGKLGRLTAVHADTAIGLGTVDAGGHSWWPEDQPEPDPLVFDWDKWLGPCLWRPYNSQYKDRGRGQFWDFHAGLLEWASHTVAMAQWAADMEHTQPVEYIPEGANFRGDGLIERYTIRCRYANGIQLILRNHSWRLLGSCSNLFEGTEGWVEVGDSGRIEVSDNLKSLVPKKQGRAYDPTAEHLREFVSCIRSRTPPRANARVTCNTHVASHAAWIAAQLNRRLEWDPEKRMFVNDEEANRMRSRAYREPWRGEALATSM